MELSLAVITPAIAGSLVVVFAAAAAFALRRRLRGRGAASAMNAFTEPMIAVDGAGALIEANDAAFALLGVSDRDAHLLQANVRSLPGLRTLLEDPSRECAEVFTGGSAATRRCHEARVISAPGDRSERRVIAIQDITSRRASEEQLIHQANFDSLTGLANRRYFVARLEDEIAAADTSRESLAVMYIDLDRFKSINDAYGHAAGDELLRIVAHRLRQRLRGGDVVAPAKDLWLARLGGDEFAVLLPHLSGPEAAANVAARLLAVLGEPVMLEGSKVWNAASIGIALYPEHGSDVDSLLRSADAALYSAKANRRGGHVLFEPTLMQRAQRQATIDRLLRAAIASDELEIQYQPKYAVSDHALGGAEALLRWEDAELGRVPPKEFVPVAEATGLIGALGEWVLERVCKDVARWRKEGLPLVPISFNVSYKQFAEANVDRMILDKLTRYELDPRMLEMELTESSILEDDEQTSASLRAIREFGMRISLDDFGTGYSSLSCLNRVPLDLLKMDRDLVRDVHVDPGARGVVAAVVSMAHSLGLEVVAEGVDCDEQLDLLKEIGCDWVQGFVLGAAMPERAFAQLLRGPAPHAKRTAATPDPAATLPAAFAPPRQAEDLSQGARALVVDDGTGRLGVLAMRLNRLGTTALYASEPDEGLLFTIEQGPPIRTLIADSDTNVADIAALLDRIESAWERAPALLFVVRDELPKPLLDLRARCRIWTLREPSTDAELREVARSTLFGTPPHAMRRHARVAWDAVATMAVGDDVQSALLTSLSVGGAFVEVPRLPPDGTSVDVSFPLGDTAISVRGVVAYHRAGNESAEPAGIGIAFERVPDAHASAIQTAIEQRAVRCLA